MPYNYALADHGSTLATRPFGKELRVDLARRAVNQEAVTLDFSGIASISHSFADEFVAHLAEESVQGDIRFAVAVSGTSAEVDRVIRQALDRRSVDLPSLV